MRLDDAVLSCTGFLARDTEPERFLGTAFIILVPGSTTVGNHFHLVTAKHVAVQLENENSTFSVTNPDGIRLDYHVPARCWVYHPTEPDSVDVAITFLFPDESQTGDKLLVGVKTSDFVTAKRIKEYEIGLGNETHTVSLFSGFTGTTHLTPLVRSGTIAMMPKERVPHPYYGSVEAFLVEGMSLNHQSGAPVFVRSTLGSKVVTPRGRRFTMLGVGPMHFLGLNSGHFTLPERQGLPAVNMQVVIVVPAQKILEVINHPDLLYLRSLMEDPSISERVSPSGGMSAIENVIARSPESKLMKGFHKDATTKLVDYQQQRSDPEPAKRAPPKVTWKIEDKSLPKVKRSRAGKRSSP